jgi:hypothetical protein
MREDKKEIYKSFEISYSVYGENSKYSAKGSVRFSLPSMGLTLVFEGLNPPSQTLDDAESRLLGVIKKHIDYYIDADKKIYEQNFLDPL